MSIIISWSDFLEKNVSHIWTNPVPVLLKWKDNELIKCVINARVLLHINSIDPEKFYRFFPSHGICAADGQWHYIANPRISDKSKVKTISINYNQPIISNAHKNNSDGDIVWYKWSITGICKEKDVFLPYVWMNSQGVKQIQYWYNSGDLLITNEIWIIKKCFLLTVGTIEIPIYNDPDGAWKSWDLIEWEEYTFDSFFWDDEGYGSYKYPQYAEYLYLSWLITDIDFDPEKSIQ